MSITASIDKLPGELNNRILSDLGVLDRIALKLTSVYFNNLVLKLSSQDLLEAEESRFALDNELHGCYDCVRLRPRARFADNQLKKKRRKFGSEATKRFCFECGLVSQYCRGSQVAIQGVLHIVCMRCNRFRLMARDEGQFEHGSLCANCWQPLKAERERQARQRIREEQAKRRERRRSLLGSDYEDSDYGSPPSPTWSEEAMQIAEAEADMYMNSPGRGSD